MATPILLRHLDGKVAWGIMAHRFESSSAAHARGRHLHYRSDIDGLRAIAVLPVVLYHLGFAVFGGGYVGVDVFFVISGFLITSVIEQEIDEGRFSIAAFYERRARRILPALFATLVVTVVVGWFLFLPDEYRKLGSRVVSVALFASNILFWKQADYFSGPIDMEPLLHTWSLAVEEQYYILWPIVLILLARFGAPSRQRWLKGAAIGLAVLSLALSVLLIDIDRTGDYYLLPTRAWELLVGALLAIGAIPRLRRRLFAEILAAAGLVSVLGSAMLLTKTSVFPGLNALWPVAGAAALIHAGTGRSTLVGRCLGLKPIVAIGLISYSLYLVHWPIIVFVKYQQMRDPTTVEAFAMLVGMILIAALSWRFVERPFRNRHAIGRSAIIGSATAAIAILVVVGLVMFRTNGLPARFPKVAPQIVEDATHSETGPTCFMTGRYAEKWAGSACFLTAPTGGPNTLLWGDSHANQYRDVFHRGIPVRIAGLLLYATGGCMPVFDATIPDRPSCRPANADVPRIIRRYRIGTVILSGDWEYEMSSNHVPTSALAATIMRLQHLGVRVKLIGDNPFYAFANPGYLGYRLSLRAAPLAPYFTTPANDWSFNRKIAAFVSKDAFFDPMAALCRASDHKCLVYDDGQLVMEDTGHLSAYGRKIVSARMGAFLSR